jgi:hypothetical protein
MAKRSTSIESVHRRLLALQNRVSFLERALRKARQKASQLPAIAERRDEAQADARRQALKDYDAQKRIATYRSSPWMLAIAQRLEDDRNAFLRSKGLKPEPSDIPTELRKEARALVSS